MRWQHRTSAVAVRARALACVATAATLTLTGALAACSNQKDGGPVEGASFSFVAPGGKTEIYYPEADRAKVGALSGPSLMEDGKTISLDDYAGKVVVLNAWGQWCGPCRSESDDLQRVYEQIKDRGGVVLGINVRDSNPQQPRDFVTDNGITYPSIYDPPFRSAAALGGFPATVVPTTIVLDKQHRPATLFLQEITDEQLLAAVSKEL